MYQQKKNKKEGRKKERKEEKKSTYDLLAKQEILAPSSPPMVVSHVPF